MACLAGAVAVRRTILEAHPEADLAVAVVWLDVMPSDDAEAARRVASDFLDPRVAQFHDPDELSGAHFADALSLERPPAFDVYLFYERGGRWETSLSRPFDWMHQLGGEGAPPERLRRGAALDVGLAEALRALGFGEGLALAPSAAKAATALDACARCATRPGRGQCSMAGWRHLSIENGVSPGELMVSGETSNTALGRPHLVFAVDGLACPDCMLHAAAGPLSLPGVERVDVDLDAASLLVFGALGAELDEAEVRETVERQGYTARTPDR